MDLNNLIILLPLFGSVIIGLTDAEFAQGPAAWALLDDPLPPAEMETEDLEVGETES